MSIQYLKKKVLKYINVGYLQNEVNIVERLHKSKASDKMCLIFEIGYQRYLSYYVAWIIA